MIISHKHKFIFIKPQKTAGTSVELLLSRICGPDDVITPLGFDPDPNVREKYKAKEPQNYKRKKPLKHWTLGNLFWFVIKWRKPHLNYREHLSADIIRKYVGEEIWHSYHKISIVRNPWDHAVSWFKWQAKYGFENTKEDKFEKYVIDNYRTTWPFYSSNGVYSIDSMIRFDNLNSDIAKLETILPSLVEFDLPITKHKVRKEGDSYQNFFDEKMKSIVAEKSCNVISRFDYNF